MDQINTLQLTAAIRQLLIFVGGFAVAKGWIDNDTMMALVPAVITLGIAGYGLYVRRTAGVVASAGTLLDGKGVIITDPKTASQVPGSNVVGSVAEAMTLPGVK